MTLAAVASGGANAATTPVTVTPAPQDFGSILEGQSSGAQTFTVTNTGATSINLLSLLPVGGSNPAEFGLANDTCSGQTLTAGGTCTFDALFTPQAGVGLRGPQTATVSVGDDAGDTPVALDLTGTAIAPQLAVSPSPVDFGDVPVGTSATQTVTISNPAQGTLAISSISTTGTGFSVETDGCTGAQLTTSQSCDVTLQYQSTATGAASGTLLVGNNDPDQQTPAPVALSANGTQPSVTFTGNSAFNADLGATSAPQTITVNNGGDAPLSITRVALGGTDAGSFGISSDGCTNATVPAGGSCDVGVTFTASDPNPKSASLLVTDNAPGSPQSNPLTGTVNVPGITITPESASFASLQVGRQSAGTQITVKNSGTALLKIGAITIAGNAPSSFRKGTGAGDTCSHKTIVVGGTCTVTVYFTPTNPGTRVADLMIPNNGPNGAVPLSGAGLWPPSPTALSAALGCDSAKVSWTLPAGMHLFLDTVIVRNAAHSPTSPTDGTVVTRTASGSFVNTGLTHYHTYYYAAYSVFGSYLGETKHYSKPVKVSGHTGTICAPRNHGVTVDLTPLSSWLPYGSGAKYSVLLQHSGRTILVRFPAGASYQFPSSWSYGGQSHALQRGGVYFLYVYAYTRAKPKGFLIGQAQFAEAR